MPMRGYDGGYGGYANYGGGVTVPPEVIRDLIGGLFNTKGHQLRQAQREAALQQTQLQQRYAPEIASLNMDQLKEALNQIRAQTGQAIAGTGLTQAQTRATAASEVDAGLRRMEESRRNLEDERLRRETLGLSGEQLALSRELGRGQLQLGEKELGVQVAEALSGLLPKTTFGLKPEALAQVNAIREAIAKQLGAGDVFAGTQTEVSGEEGRDPRGAQVLEAWQKAAGAATPEPETPEERIRRDVNQRSTNERMQAIMGKTPGFGGPQQQQPSRTLADVMDAILRALYHGDNPLKPTKGAR